jgi:adenine-specific DNA-methyltransferase
MNISNLKNSVFIALKTDDRIWNEQKTELNQTLLLDLLDKIDEKIIGILLENEELRGKFFVKIKDANKEIFVFKTNDFKFFLEENKIYNSYTKYQNQIGLTDGKRFLKDSGDVVLDFPFKDCVLEGGQSTEEGLDTYFEYEEEKKKTANGETTIEPAGYKQKQEKRKEIFFNQILAKDEIDRLQDQKALVGWKRFSQKGEQDVSEIKRDANGTIKENLIIKGNNLLALHSLKSQFAGKVKLIYIDPPYNTGNDGFKYNDNFNHSSWLTFMKNRLEVARDLLKDDGVIFVQIDNSPTDLKESPEFGYLYVLMDEIFCRKNYITSLIWKKKGGASNTKDNIGTITESILMYGKNFDKISLHLQEFKRSYKYEDEFGRYNVGQPVKTNNGGYERKTMLFTLQTPEGNFNPPSGKRWINGEEKMRKIIENKKYQIINNEFYVKSYAEDYLKGEFKLYNNLLTEQGSLKIAKGELEILGFDRENFSTPKPEILLERIIKIATKSNDLVLDFFAGSGTTLAVVHKMGRQYIGIEQMDYIKDITCERIKKVIEGEQGGISKSVNWQGGGDFIYLELAKNNETAKEKILDCDNLKELEALFDELYDKYFLNYNLKIKEFKDKVLQEEEFKNLELDEQKRMFLTMLDLNQMYVNKSEMADRNFAISKQDQELTKEFYKTD